MSDDDEDDTAVETPRAKRREPERSALYRCGLCGIRVLERDREGHVRRNHTSWTPQWAEAFALDGDVAARVGDAIDGPIQERARRRAHRGRR